MFLPYFENRGDETEDPPDNLRVRSCFRIFVHIFPFLYTIASTPTVFLFLTLAKCLENAGYVPRAADAFGNAPSQREAHFRCGCGETKLPWGGVKVT